MSLSNDGVDQVGVAIELVLDNIVEDLEQEKDQVVVGRSRIQEPWRREGFEQMQQFDAGHHRERLQVRRNVNKDCEQAIEQGLQTLTEMDLRNTRYLIIL